MHESFVLPLLLLTWLPAVRAADALTFADPKPQRYEFTARASEIDSRARPHPEIDFVFERGAKPADVEHASVDTRVPPQGKLVIWLMGYSAPLFERVNSYGLHAIRVHYANGWFAQFGKEPPPADDKFLGKIRRSGDGRGFQRGGVPHDPGCSMDLRSATKKPATAK